MSLGPQLKSSYKDLVRSLVRSTKRSRIQQLENSQKKEVALLKYDLIKLNRLQALAVGSSSSSSSSSSDAGAGVDTVKKILEVKNRIKLLENSSIEKSKALFFYPQTSQFKELIINFASKTAGNATVNEEQHQTQLLHKIKHLTEVSHFLINQSEYDELIERYNPGMTMSQEEKVKRTANKVGFEIPPELQ